MISALMVDDLILMIFFVVAMSSVEIGAHIIVSIRLLGVVGNHARFRECYHILMATQFANMVTPFKAGIPARIFLYKRIFLLDPKKGVGIVFIETILLLLAVAIVGTVGVVLFFADRSVLGIASLAAILILFLVALGLLSIYLRKIDVESVSNEYFRRVIEFVQNLFDSVANLDIRISFLVTGLFVVSLLAQGLRLSIVLAFFSVSATPLELTCALAIAYTAGAVSMLPFGLGARDGALAVLLLGGGMDAGGVTIAVLAQRVFSPGMYLFLGVYSYYSLFKTVRSIPK